MLLDGRGGRGTLEFEVSYERPPAAAAAAPSGGALVPSAARPAAPALTAAAVDARAADDDEARVSQWSSVTEGLVDALRVTVHRADGVRWPLEQVCWFEDTHTRSYTHRRKYTHVIAWPLEQVCWFDKQASTHTRSIRFARNHPL